MKNRQLHVFIFEKGHRLIKLNVSFNCTCISVKKNYELNAYDIFRGVHS